MPVTSKHPQYQEHIREWEDCQNFFDGEQAVKEAGTRYLPRPEQSTKSEYEAYVMRAFFFPAMERTVSGLAGAIDRKAPTYKLPQRLQYLEDNADSENNSLRQFSKSCLDQCFIKGRYGVLVERPERGGDPYLTLYHAEDIINWNETEDGLQLVVLREVYYEQDLNDEFLMQKKTRYRVLKLEDGYYVQHIYVNGFAQEQNTYYRNQEITPSRAGIRLDFIPFVFGNVRSITSKIDKPPLLDLVRKNAEHYRVSADYANALYFTGNPILWVRGVKRPAQSRPTSPGEVEEPQFKLTLGSSRAVYLPNQDAEIGLTECSGHGVNPNHDKAEDVKKEMAVLGARLLEQQRNGVETAETAQIRQSAETSTLAGIVLSVSSTIRKSLEMADKWMGGNGKDIEFELNNDFVDVTINPQLVSTLADMVSKEFISWDTFIYNLRNGELLPPGRTAEEERDLIEAQPPMGQPDLSMFMGEDNMSGWQGDTDGSQGGENGAQEPEEEEEDKDREEVKNKAKKGGKGA